MASKKAACDSSILSVFPFGRQQVRLAEIVQPETGWSSSCDLTSPGRTHSAFVRLIGGGRRASAPVPLHPILTPLAERRAIAVSLGSHTEVRDLLAPILRLPNFKVLRRQTVVSALDIYASTNLDFGDAFIVASMQAQGSNLLYSYDGDFDRIPDLTRVEP